MDNMLTLMRDLSQIFIIIIILIWICFYLFQLLLLLAVTGNKLRVLFISFRAKITSLTSTIMEIHRLKVILTTMLHKLSTYFRVNALI